jgi:hypothetical protein
LARRSFSFGNQPSKWPGMLLSIVSIRRDGAICSSSPNISGDGAASR